MRCFHRLLRSFVMRDHIHPLFAYPHNGELIAAIEVLSSVYQERDGSHMSPPLPLKCASWRPALGLTKHMALVSRARATKDAVAKHLDFRNRQ